MIWDIYKERGTESNLEHYDVIRDANDIHQAIAKWEDKSRRVIDGGTYIFSARHAAEIVKVGVKIPEPVVTVNE